MHASFSQDVKSKANPKNHTVESILLDTIDRDNTEELDIFQIEEIFRELARTDILHASIEREPVETDTLFIDIVAYVEDKKDTAIGFGCLYIHIFNIEWINNTEFDEIAKEIQDIVDRANAKVIRLESIFEGSLSLSPHYMQPTAVQIIAHQEVSFKLLRQGDKVSKNLFEYISTYYVVEPDEYNTGLLNVMSTDDEPEELMQLYPEQDDTYIVYYLE